eukprot:TRINITY_DN53950_c0_g1_i1.p1 TRINITY_DN53950_c0_g1~~TRINITY_DN53950_c0_g1_i1.p1  ORF type:complete len:246 (+),score=23.34 TRINITY_DN53950_c0_g1_i1:74-739(+)
MLYCYFLVVKFFHVFLFFFFQAEDGIRDVERSRGLGDVYKRQENDTDNTSNSVKMLDYFVFRKHICITFEMLGQNLYEYIRDTDFKGLPLDLIKKYAIQLLHSLEFLKKHSIVHCDLKPENVLISRSDKSIVRLIDFGSGCFQEEQIYTYIQSRFYRAPEIMLAIPSVSYTHLTCRRYSLCRSRWSPYHQKKKKTQYRDYAIEIKKTEQRPQTVIRASGRT